ncbi:hypothetical protein [Pelosinus sp. UFO1]|uniref:hypothetical protein n=1 Tax=Pelosinus sp. UFO1 TaxID=484770 RepID=UPI0004D19519|nr:hypothetical protein [Pelosinus sp. UFO1]AIF51231.1 hypothetical protein UFO1_1680 [Pelosinus sp. UFO1]
MDCIKEAENYLRYYRELHQSIEHADYMISKLVNQTAPNDMSAVSMDITGIRAGKPCNTLNQMYQLQVWQEMKERTMEEIAKVDNVLDTISQDTGCEIYRNLLYMWYVEKKVKQKIAEELGYSHKQSVYEIKNKAIKKFAVALFGVSALEAI